MRQNHPQIGTRKLYRMLNPFLSSHGIKIGRDALFDLLASNKLLVRKMKRKVQTTYSMHWLRKYPNLIKDIIPISINQVWVSDITYWKITTGEHLYISLITDAYSRKIIGYNVAATMEAIESIKALQMALSSFDKTSAIVNLTHHSDRGIQYCSNKYVKLLQDYEIKISMTEGGDPLDNAIAERVNGILKDEYLDHYKTNSLRDATKQLCKAINLYNNQRPHMSISNLVPQKVHSQNNVITKRLWKNYYKKLNNFNQNYPVNLL